MHRPNRATATGTIFDSGVATQSTCYGFALTGGVDAATAVFRETDGSGTILAALGVGAGLSASLVLPVTFKQKIHVTITGTTPHAIVYV